MKNRRNFSSYVSSEKAWVSEIEGYYNVDKSGS